MLAYRITKQKHPPYDGAGALLHGGRWNPPGQAVIYASDAYAGALLEILVHANLGRLPGPHHAVQITIPHDVALETLEADAHPGWDAPDLTVSRTLGAAWLAARRTAVLVVPSVTSQPFGRTVLINPQHPDAQRIHVADPAPVTWDARLFQQSASAGG